MPIGNIVVSDFIITIDFSIKKKKKIVILVIHQCIMIH